MYNCDSYIILEKPQNTFFAWHIGKNIFPYGIATLLKISYLPSLKLYQLRLFHVD